MPDIPKQANDSAQPPADRTLSVLRSGIDDAHLAGEAIKGVHGRLLCDPAALLEFLSNPARYLLLAVQGGRVVGSLAGHALRQPYRREPQFLLYEIDVLPEFRNRGIGEALVARFIEEARAAEAFEVWVLTNRSNKAAMALYTRCGLGAENPDDVMMNLKLNGGEG